MPMKTLEELIAQWHALPETSRTAVLTELQELGDGWTENAYDEDTRQDAATIRLAVNLLRALTPPGS